MSAAVILPETVIKASFVPAACCGNTPLVMRFPIDAVALNVTDVLESTRTAELTVMCSALITSDPVTAVFPEKTTESLPESPSKLRGAGSRVVTLPDASSAYTPLVLIVMTSAAAVPRIVTEVVDVSTVAVVRIFWPLSFSVSVALVLFPLATSANDGLE